MNYGRIFLRCAECGADTDRYVMSSYDYESSIRLHEQKGLCPKCRQTGTLVRRPVPDQYLPPEEQAS